MLPLKEIAQVHPSERQLAWQALEFYAFIHFGMNTFIDREWGKGNEDTFVFNPSRLDAAQWVEVCASAGMRGLILSCKHHDGFCLWPSAFTEHSVRASPWRGGKGDLVREVSDAYNTFYKNQLTELLSDYGDVFAVWLDGACGEGPNGKRQRYDWDGYYEVVRKLQPDAVISVCGPDVRWCGNEAGSCRSSEWSVVPAALRECEKNPEKSQKIGEGTSARLITSQDEDLGSREALRGVAEFAWYPAEVDTSIRPGWFYHAAEDGKVKTLETLLKIYHESVGGNAALLLNLPPDQRGLIHETDAERMRTLGRALAEAYRTNLAKDSTVTATESRGPDHGPQNALEEDTETFWCPREGTEAAALEVDLGSERYFDRVVIMEHIRSGQRIERYALDCREGVNWKECARGTVVGYKRICLFVRTRARYLRLRIMESRWCPTVAFVGVYDGHALGPRVDSSQQAAL